MALFPDYEGRYNIFTYMGWQLITDPTSLQYKLREESGQVFDGEGFGTVDGRYAIACTETFGSVGDYIDFYSDNGMVFQCCIADIKSSSDPNWTIWGHVSGGGLSVLEFVVDRNTWYPAHANPGTPSFHPEWQGRIVKAESVGNYWTGSSVDMSNVILITATKANGTECSYVGSQGEDGYVYFNDSMFYRFKPAGTWEQNLYVLNRWRHSWTKCTMFTKLSAKNLNSGSGSVAPGGQGVEDAIQWALAIARDNSHGYDQGSRWGPDYDCSSLVYEAFRVGGGFDLPVHSGYTGTMVADFTAAGFTWLPGIGNSASELQRGDILLNIQAHVEIYLGENMNVGAHINEFGGIIGGQPGDQTGNEISEGGFYSFPWDGVLRKG